MTATPPMAAAMTMRTVMVVWLFEGAGAEEAEADAAEEESVLVTKTCVTELPPNVAEGIPLTLRVVPVNEGGVVAAAEVVEVLVGVLEVDVGLLVVCTD